MHLDLPLPQRHWATVSEPSHLYNQIQCWVDDLSRYQAPYACVPSCPARPGGRPVRPYRILAQVLGGSHSISFGFRAGHLRCNRAKPKAKAETTPRASAQWPSAHSALNMIFSALHLRGRGNREQGFRQTGDRETFVLSPGYHQVIVRERVSDASKSEIDGIRQAQCTSTAKTVHLYSLHTTGILTHHLPTARSVSISVMNV